VNSNADQGIDHQRISRFFPLENTASRRPASGETEDDIDQKLRDVQRYLSRIEVQSDGEEAEPGGSSRFGEGYEQYREVEDLPPVAKAFYSRAGTSHLTHDANSRINTSWKLK
jgi:hypothetical protein